MTPSGSTQLENEVILKAKEEGFCSAGIVLPNMIPKAPHRLTEFLTNGWHGQMSWMENRQFMRSSPLALWSSVKSIIMVAESYTPKSDVLTSLKYADKGNISVYAHGSDYHSIIKKKLKRLGSWLVKKTGAEIKVFVDTAPVMEKPLAQAAGLGWQGKHTNLVSKNMGNWFFLGAIFTNLDLNDNLAESDHCGTCRRCLDVCPTSAIVEPYKLDASRCISYLTIEHSGPVDLDLRSLLGNRIYGCDDCLAVCPWNKHSKKANEIAYHSKKYLQLQPLEKLVYLNDEKFREKFSGSPIKRIGRNRFVRNVLYAIGNSGLRKFNNAVRDLMSDKDFSVRDAASWAILKLKEKNEQ